MCKSRCRFLVLVEGNSKSKVYKWEIRTIVTSICNSIGFCLFCPFEAFYSVRNLVMTQQYKSPYSTFNTALYRLRLQNVRELIWQILLLSRPHVTESNLRNRRPEKKEMLDGFPLNGRPHFWISSTDSKVGNSLYILNTNTGRHCPIIFIWWYNFEPSQF